jgi:hypothetical protein
LIDLDFTPTEIKSKIVEAYDEYKPKTKSNMLNYFMDKRLKALMEVSEEF